MLPTPIPQAKQAIVQTLSATINHNLPVMMYVFGALLMVVLLLYKPNRRLMLFLLGFILLAFHFEYVKHIADPLLEQTRVSIESTGYESARGRRVMDIVFDDLIPFVAYLGGWGAILLGIIVSNVPWPKRLRINRMAEPTSN